MVFVKSLFHVRFGTLAVSNDSWMSNFAKISIVLCTRKCFNSYHFSSEMLIIVHFIYGGDFFYTFLFPSSLVASRQCCLAVIYYYFYSAFKVVNLLKLLNVSDTNLAEGSHIHTQKNADKKTTRFSHAVTTARLSL